MTVLLETHDLNVTAGGKTICRNLSLTIMAGNCWGILGANGAGKTTLLHTLAGLRPPASGEIRLGEQNLIQLSERQRAQRLGVLFQDNTDPFPATVLETALTGRHPHLSPWQWESAADIQRAEQALETLGLLPLAQRDVATLSGGERQRLAAATLLTQAPDLMLLDEPTNHLDLHYQIQLLDTLTAQTHNNTRAMLMVLHDINLALRYCDHLLLLFDGGEVLSGAATDIINEERLQRLYGHPVSAVQGPRGTAYLPL